MSTSASVSEIVKFVEARISEDESVARAAQVAATYPQFGDTAADALLGLAESEGAQSEALRHVARHDPARVLADCVAKRQLIELANAADMDGHDGYAETIHRALALTYADHPAYDHAWRQ